MSDPDDGGQYDFVALGLIDDAWEEFMMTGRPTALARYLELGGEVDAGVREILVHILRNGPDLRNKGGRDRWRDYLTFIEVRDLQRRDKISKTKACCRLAEWSNQTQRAVEMQFDRGSKIYTDECDIFERLSTKSEK